MSKHISSGCALAVLAALVSGAACKTGADPKVRSEITAKLESAHDPITACYQNQLYVNRKLRGMYVAQMAINADTGAFGEITLRRDEPQDPVLRYCVIQAIAKLRLDKPPGKRIELDSVPIKFEPSNP